MAGIQDLIAQQQGPNPMGAVYDATRTLSAMEGLGAQREGRQMQRQQMMQEQQMMQQKMEQERRLSGLKFMADSAVALDNEPDPAKKQALYRQLHNLASMQGMDTRKVPLNYTPEAHNLLQMAKAQVYGKEMMGGGMSAYQRENLGLQKRRLDLESQLTPSQAANIEIQNRKINAQYDPTVAAAIEAAKTRANLETQGEIAPSVEAAKTRAKTTAKADVERSENIIKSIADEQEVVRILDKAEPLLKKATESLAGASIDAAGRLIGVSTEGSRSAAQLKTLEGALIMKMPRMEGPQSNMDQQLYRQMAAQIGDATVPADQRRAAVDTLRYLNSRYSGQSAQQPPPVSTATTTAAPNTSAPQGWGNVRLKQ